MPNVDRSKINCFLFCFTIFELNFPLAGFGLYEGTQETFKTMIHFDMIDYAPSTRAYFGTHMNVIKTFLHDIALAIYVRTM